MIGDPTLLETSALILTSMAGALAGVGAIVFLIRKRQRVGQLRWEIPVAVVSIELNLKDPFNQLTECDLTTPITLKRVLAASQDQQLLDRLIEQKWPGVYEQILVIGALYEEFRFWGWTIGWLPNPLGNPVFALRK